LSPEKIVFISIGIIMLMVLFFALGVEKGKSIAARIPVVKATSVAAVQPAISQSTVKMATANTAQTKAPLTPTSITSKNSAEFDNTKPYTVVAGAFSRQDFAAQEVNKLKSSGLEAFVYYAQPYYLACIGSFANKDSAKEVLSRVRQMRRDAYVRLR